LRAALDSLGLAYAVVGSVASSARSIPRSTQDIDLIVRIAPFHVQELVAALGSGWYADADAMRSAIRDGRSFNVIHMTSAWKIDLFPAQTEFHASELQRATVAQVSLDGESVECPVSSAEDIVLAKLCWYKDGGSVSERQWNDIGTVIVTNPGLDRDYLSLWAARLGVADLLERAFADSAA
jgi:hypothetical protein